MGVELNTQKIDVFSLSITEPSERNLKFDPQRDLSRDFWLAMEKTKSLTISQKAALARDLKIFAPHKLEEFGITEPNFADIIPEHPNFGLDNIPFNIRAEIAGYNVAFPGFRKRVFSEITFSRNHLAEPNFIFEGTRSISWQRIGMFPEELDKLRPHYIDSIALKKDFEKESVYGKAYAAAMFRLVYPGTFSHLTLDEHFWEIAKGILDYHLSPPSATVNNFPWNMMCQLARDLTIISAHRGEITKEGIVIELEKPQDESGASPLPHERSF